MTLHWPFKDNHSTHFKRYLNMNTYSKTIKSLVKLNYLILVESHNTCPWLISITRLTRLNTNLANIIPMDKGTFSYKYPGKLWVRNQPFLYPRVILSTYLFNQLIFLFMFRLSTFTGEPTSTTPPWSPLCSTLTSSLVILCINKLIRSET